MRAEKVHCHHRAHSVLSASNAGQFGWRLVQTLYLSKCHLILPPATRHCHNVAVLIPFQATTDIHVAWPKSACWELLASFRPP